MATEQQVRHLEMIQHIISRQANSSFLIKGWCITVSGALLAVNLGALEDYRFLVIIASAILFWMLDGCFLQNERLFRHLYEDVCSNPQDTPFSMNVDRFRSQCTWFDAVISHTMIALYGGLIGLALFAHCYLRAHIAS